MNYLNLKNAKKMKNLLAFILLITSIDSLFGQVMNDPLKKLQSTKELYELGLINKKEFDSIANELKEIILSTQIIENKKIDGFYINQKRMIPEKFAESKLDVLGSALTGGLAGGSTKSILIGDSSKNILDRKNQIFKLYINQNVDVNGNTISNISNQQFFSNAQSPDDFTLVKLKVDNNKNERSVKIGSMSLTGGYSFQIKKKFHLPFEWNQIKDFEYTIKTNLESGEYAFVFTGTTAFSNAAVFTFSIK